MAAPVLTAPQVNDLVAMTLRDLGKPKFTDISSRLQRHTAMKHLLRQNRIQLASGYGVQWDVMIDFLHNARFVGLGASDVVDDQDTMVQATADWRLATTNYPLIGPVVDMNREPARIVNYVQEKRIATLIGMAELMEVGWWGSPVAITDSVTPWGVNTWIVKNTSQGFNGGVPSGYTTIGLNPVTYPNWNNYTDSYTAVARDDLVRKARRAAEFTHFEPPVDGIPTPNTGDEYGFYTNYAVKGQLREQLESQNDNLGTDIAPYDGGNVLFLNVPIMWVPALEADTTNPFYGVNWGWMKTYILEGWWLKETHIPIYPGAHTQSAHFIDAVFQWITKNRRCHFVIATAATYPA